MKVGIMLIAMVFFVTNNFSTTPYQEKKSLNESIKSGKLIYTEFCIQCHLGDGKGSATIPPLAASDWLVNQRKESIHAVKFGQKGPIIVNGKTYNNAMSSMGLLDEEIADVMNYVMNSWGNKQKKPVTTAEVAAINK